MERVALVAFICVVVALGSRAPIFKDLSLRCFDQLVVWAHWPSPSSEILVVDFDDDTAAHYKTFPVPRSEVARTIRKIAAGHPELIGLDMLLTEARPQDDEEMASALQDAGNVVIASIMGSSRQPPVEPLPKFCDPDPQAAGFCRAGAFAVGLADVPADTDGFIRRMYLLPHKSYDKLPFAVVLATNFLHQPLDKGANGLPTFSGKAISLDANGLNTYTIGVWAQQIQQRVSARRVLADEIDPQMFRGKIVLIGQSSEMARDQHFSPMFHLRRADGSPLMISGTDLQGLAISTLLQRRAVRTLESWRLWLLVILLTAVIVNLASRWSPLKVSTAAVAMVAAFVAFCVWALGRHAVWIDLAPCVAAVATALPATFGWRFVKERWLTAAARAERQQLMSIFSRYVSPEIAEQIWSRRNEILLAGEDRTATVLFSDIRSFTALSAGKPSAEVLAWLNEYFTEMSAVVRKHGGFVNKFIGDGLMALYGVPLSAGVEEDACNAVRAAMEMMARVDELNRRHSGEPTWPILRIGVGIHTGVLTAGSVGANDRLEYSVIGETVNLASRLESATKDAHVPIVLSSDTQRFVGERIATIPLGEANIRGFDRPIMLYTVEVATIQTPAAAAISASRS
ncbi:MAG: CHASE2 domain-containing protein [Terriglobales bacterium]